MADNLSNTVDMSNTEIDVDIDACEQFCDGQLSFIGHSAKFLPGKLIDDYSKVTQRLDVSNNKINSVAGLEEFCNLEELVLDNNNITDSTVFPHLEHLRTLTLNKNKLTDLEHLLEDVKCKFPKLTYLSLLGNAACPNQLSSAEKDDEDYLRYRYFVLYHLPKLKFLDSTLVKTSDLEEANRVGPFMSVVRCQDGMETQVPNGGDSLTSSYLPYNPLPTTNSSTDQHQGTYGKSKYIYYGKHSEGNRFIRNTDL